MGYFRSSFLLLICCSLSIFAAAQATVPAGLDQSLEQWKSAIATGDATTLQSLYSIDPPAYVLSADGKQQLPISDELGFWGKVQPAGMQDFSLAVGNAAEQQGLEVVTLRLSFRTTTPNGPRQRYVVEQQAWQKQPTGWRMIGNTRSPLLKMRPPEKLDPHLYDETADAKAEIAEAVKKAAAANQRVILMFGGNWCYDCHVLNAALHEPDVAPAARNFIVVHVDIGQDGKKNADLAQKYRIPLDKGVPALAVLSKTGALLYSQQNGEFESARSMDPDDLVAFLNHWKAATP